MVYVLAVLFIIICLLLIGVILLQKGRGGGLSAAFGGGGGGHSAFGSRTGDVFTWVTVVLVGLFLLTSVALVKTLMQPLRQESTQTDIPAAETPGLTPQTPGAQEDGASDDGATEDGADASPPQEQPTTEPAEQGPAMRAPPAEGGEPTTRPDAATDGADE